MGSSLQNKVKESKISSWLLINWAIELSRNKTLTYQEIYRYFHSKNINDYGE